MHAIKFFDYYKIAKEMDISEDSIIEIEKEVRIEFPDDIMMFELHVMRVLKSKSWKDNNYKTT